MSQKVYFRNAEGKAIILQIKDKVIYQKAVDSINTKFKIPKENIKLIYNGQTYTQDFNLNKQIPHHIVHIIDTRNVGPGQIQFNLVVQRGKTKIPIKNAKVNTKSTIKQFVDNLIEQKFKRSVIPDNAAVYHRGIKLPENSTFEEQEITNNASLNIVLQDGEVQYPVDPQDVETTTNQLYKAGQAAALLCLAQPRWSNYTTQINSLLNSPFFRKLQQSYQYSRGDIVYEQFGPYIFPWTTGGEGIDE